MTKNTISYEGHAASSRCPAIPGGTMVSLHGHTLYSRESLDFIYRLAASFAPLRLALARGAARYRSIHGSDLDLTRAWWTPPLAPHDAWLLESGNIERKFGARPLVSLTDHDNIEAPVTLRILDDCSHLPVSVEWTVPVENTFFHLGIHNLPPDSARQIMAVLSEYTTSPDESRLGDLLASIAGRPEVLIVFNHPCWDEQMIGQQSHMDCAQRFAARYKSFLHAFELNGFRPWSENRRAIAFAHACGKPIVSGGDRHALEPNTVLNLTGAATFDEFVAEVRSGYSHVLVTAPYFDAFSLRVLHNIEQVLADHSTHGAGWVKWTERAFYLCDDDVVRSFAELWKHNMPAPVGLFVGAIQLLRASAVSAAIRNIMAGCRVPRPVEEVI